MLAHPFVGIDRRHFPTWITWAYNFNHRCAFASHAVLECFLNGCLCLAHCCRSVDALTGYVACSFEQCHGVRHFERISVQVNPTSVRRCGCLHSYEGGWCHLSSGHTVNCIVNKDNCNIDGWNNKNKVYMMTNSLEIIRKL